LKSDRAPYPHRPIALALVAAALLHVAALSLGQPELDQSISPRTELQARWRPSIERSSAGSSKGIAPEQQYIERWRTSMERFATRHFPARVTGVLAREAPVLEVVVSSDGSLGELRIRRSSGDGRLDRAALDLVREAAPFETFPAPLAARQQSLRFAYEWRFETGEPNR
jgi:TonB family protein